MTADKAEFTEDTSAENITENEGTRTEEKSQASTPMHYHLAPHAAVFHQANTQHLTATVLPVFSQFSLSMAMMVLTF